MGCVSSSPWMGEHSAADVFRRYPGLDRTTPWTTLSPGGVALLLSFRLDLLLLLLLLVIVHIVIVVIVAVIVVVVVVFSRLRGRRRRMPCRLAALPLPQFHSRACSRVGFIALSSSWPTYSKRHWVPIVAPLSSLFVHMFFAVVRHSRTSSHRLFSHL